MIELKRLKLINWHNFENTTFDCARLTYMIGVNAVGKTTILDAIRYCLTTNRNFNALGNKKSGRTLQGVRCTQSSAARTPTAARGHTVAYIGAEFWDSVKHTSFVIAVRVESKAPCRSCTPATRRGTSRRTAARWKSCPSSTRAPVPPAPRRTSSPPRGRFPTPAAPAKRGTSICRALGIGRAASPLGKKFNEVFQMGTSMDEIPNFREFLYQYILPQPELDLEALQGDRLELENLHAVLAEAQTRADALDEIVRFGREATEKQTEALVNRGAALLARAAADGGEQTVWQERVDAGRRQQETLRTRYADSQERRGGSPPRLPCRPQCSRCQRRGTRTGRPQRGAGIAKRPHWMPPPAAPTGRKSRRKDRQPAGCAAPQRFCRRAEAGRPDTPTLCPPHRLAG